MRIKLTAQQLRELRKRRCAIWHDTNVDQLYWSATGNGDDRIVATVEYLVAQAGHDSLDDLGDEEIIDVII